MWHVTILFFSTEECPNPSTFFDSTNANPSSVRNLLDFNTIIKSLEVRLTTNANLALCSLSAKMEETMKEHHQIQSHTNALGGQDLRLTLQLGQMDDLNVCLVSILVCMRLITFK